MPLAATFMFRRLVFPFLILGITGGVHTVPASAAPRDSSRSLAAQLGLGPGVSNHPVGVVPSSSVRIPETWPLDSRGAIMCVTCHEAVPSLDGSAGPRLRDFEGGAGSNLAFCARCHNHDGRGEPSSMHWQALGVAHVVPDAGGLTASQGLLDRESRRCLECHDGVNAVEHTSGPFEGRIGYRGDPRRSHPVGVPYRSAPGRSGSAVLRPEVLLPPEVRLPGGSVSCVSCHDLYAMEPRRLAVPLEGSRLCFTCHDMD
jgi:predicted CXXCH cytochrome family protein